MDLASVVAALASVGVRVSGSAPNSSVQVDSSRACPTGLAGPEPSGTINDPGQHFQAVGSTAHACRAQVCGCGSPALSLWRVCPVGGCAPRGWRQKVSPGGMTSHRCEGRLVSGAFPLPGGRQAPLPVFPGDGCRGCGDPAPAPQRALPRTGVACCGGWRQGVLRASPGGVSRAIGRGACPPLAALPGRAVEVRCPCAVGAGGRVWEPGTVPLACMPCGGLRAAGVVGDRTWGRTSHRSEGRLVSGAFPLPAAPPCARAARPRRLCFPGAGGAGVGTQHWSHSVRFCEPALRAVGVAGGRHLGGLPRAVVRGV